MKVSDIAQKVNDVYAQNIAALQNQTTQGSNQNVKQQESVPAVDKVEFSSGSRLLQRVNEAADVMDVQRTEKIDQVRNQIQAGTYEVNPDKIAGAMMKDLIKEIG
jgi:negative regulator of flagellin synthesis FlgM